MTKIQNNKIPSLRFPGFEGKWEKASFGNIFSFCNTNSFSRSLLNYETGKVKNIHYGDIHTKFKTNFDIKKEIVPFVNEDIDLSNIKEESYCIKGDLVIADASEDYKDIGKTIEIRNLNDQKLLSGLHTYIARDINKKTALGFNGYLMQTENIRKQMMRTATGISVLGISKGNLSNLKLHIPSIPEQQKIASFLTTVDDKINQFTRKKTLLEQYKKGLMQKIFKKSESGLKGLKDDRISEENKIQQSANQKNPNSDILRFKDDNGKDFPEWEEKKLGEVANNINYGMNSAAINFDGNNKYIRITDIDEDTRKFVPKPLTSPDGVLDEKYKLKNGDIVFARTGASVGKTYIYKESDGNLYFAGYLIKFSITWANPTFIFYQTLRNEYENWVQVMSMRSGQPGINAEEFKTFKVFIPSHPEQQKIANFLTTIDKKIELVNTQLEKTQAFKRGLLQQMFV